MSTLYEQCELDTGGNSELLLQCVVAQLASDNGDAAEKLEDAEGSSRDLFLVICAALVFYMQAGFAMVCAGSVRRKNVQNSMLKNLLDACGASVGFWAVGYAFAFGSGSDPNGFIGTTNFFLMDVSDYAFFIFQYGFSAAAATIVAGTLSERCQMTAYFYYSLFLCSFVYPIVAHSIWSSQGFLSPFKNDPFLGVGVIDFAGSGVVHSTGGVTALVAAWILGPRRGRFHDVVTGELLEEPMKIVGHSVSLQMVGVFILWFCWYGFNGGSAFLLNAEEPSKVAALAVTNTTLAAGAGGLVALFANMVAMDIREGIAKYDLSPAMNGVLTGLVAITAGCGVVEPWAAVVIGCLAGLVYLLCSWLLIRYRIDDAVNGIPVHLGGGLLGMLSVGFFTSSSRLDAAYGNGGGEPGLFYSFADGNRTNASLLGAQVVGCLFVIGWTVGLMLPFFTVMSRLGILRSDASDEVMGLDKSFHGGIHNGAEDGLLLPGQQSAYKNMVEETLKSGELGGRKLGDREMEEFKIRSREVLGSLPGEGKRSSSKDPDNTKRDGSSESDDA